MRNYIELKRTQPIYLGALTWNTSLTDLIELITALWKMGVFKTQTGELASKKNIVNTFEYLLGIKLKNYEMTQSKAINRKDSAPFLSKLKQNFIDFVNSKLE